MSQLKCLNKVSQTGIVNCIIKIYQCVVLLKLARQNAYLSILHLRSSGFTYPSSHPSKMKIKGRRRGIYEIMFFQILKKITDFYKNYFLGNYLPNGKDLPLVLIVLQIICGPKDLPIAQNWLVLFVSGSVSFVARAAQLDCA